MAKKEKNKEFNSEMIVKELVDFSELLEKNPDAEIPDMWRSAYERGDKLACKCIDSLKEPGDLLTTDAIDNTRVLYLTAVRLSMFCATLMNQIAGGDPAVSIKAMVAYEKLRTSCDTVFGKGKADEN